MGITGPTGDAVKSSLSNTLGTDSACAGSRGPVGPIGPYGREVCQLAKMTGSFFWLRRWTLPGHIAYIYILGVGSGAAASVKIEGYLPIGSGTDHAIHHN